MLYRREIDGLRALAVVPVILFHAGAPGFGGGFVGVDVFFVISGFLITGLLLEEFATGRFSVGSFYERRARRILPALFVVLAASLPPAWMLLSPGDLRDFGQSLVAVPLFGSNLLFWQQSGYFDTSAELKPLLHTWSLSVEEQFYLLFPLLLGWCAQRGRRLLLVVVGGISLASLTLAEALLRESTASAFYLLPARAWELGLGCLLALRRADAMRTEPAWLAEVCALIGLLMIATAVAAFDHATPFPGLRALLPTLGACLLLQFATQLTVVGRLLALRPLVGVGLVSYSAYLWHFPLFAFARHAMDQRPGLPLLLGLAVTSLVLATLSWRFVEQPFRERRRVPRAVVLRSAGASAGVFVLLGLACVLGKGFPSLRLDKARQEVLATAVASPRRKVCHTGGANFLKPAQACRYFSEHPTWAVFGDSHGVELAYGLAEELRPMRDGVAHFSFSGCTPTTGEEPSPVPGCSDWSREALGVIAQDPTLRRVVVVFRLHAALFGRHEESYPRLPNEHTDAERTQLWQAYLSLTRELLAQGKEVYALLQAPELPTRIDELVRRAVDPTEVPGVTRDWWDARSAYVAARLSELPPEVTVLDPASLFCDSNRCFAVHEGVARYFDDDHYSVAGAREVARALLARAAARDSKRP